MPHKLHPPRVSAAYAALLIEALEAGGCLILTRKGESDTAQFRQRLLQANVLAQLELLRSAAAPSGHLAEIAHVFALTPSGEALAQAAGRTDAPKTGPAT